MPTRTPTATGTPTPGETGEMTRQVFDETTWFATEYGPATVEFRSLTGRMRDLAYGLSRRSMITAANVATLRTLADRIEVNVEDRLAPHFDTSPSVVADTRELIDRIETLRAREDWDRVVAALSELSELHATFATESYVSRTFPRDPVRGPLVRYVARSGHAGDVVVVAYHVEADAVVRVQQSPSAYPGTPPGGRADVERYRTQFGPLAAGPAGDAVGTAGAYFTVTSPIGGRTAPMAVRRYRDATSAGKAIEQLLTGSVTEGGTAQFGGREWRRVFYRSAENADVMYADLTRAGPFLVVAGPSRRPWDDRPSDWIAPLELTWLWEGSER